MSEYTQAALPEPKSARIGLQKSFRTHDGRRGNRAAIKAYIGEDGVAYAEAISGTFNPADAMATYQMRMMMRELGDRMRGWAYENGATIGTDGKDFLSGACS